MSYSAHEWENGEVVTAEKLNKLENGVAAAADGSIFQDTKVQMSGTTASGDYAHSEGKQTQATGYASHSEGNSTLASAENAHAEGQQTKASAGMSHAEGNYSTASASCAHAEGQQTTASGVASHAEGNSTTASGSVSHAEGNGTVASGNRSHAEGDYTIAKNKDQLAFGMYNIADPSTAAANARGTYIEIVGNGTAENARSNARTLDWDGNEVLAGGLTVDGTGGITIGSTTLTETQLIALLAMLD